MAAAQRIACPGAAKVARTPAWGVLDEAAPVGAHSIGGLGIGRRADYRLGQQDGGQHPIGVPGDPARW